MPYQVADYNNGPFSATYTTQEQAEAEREQCIAEGVAAALAAGAEHPREEIEQDARDFYCIVRTDDDGNVVEEL